MLEGRIKAALTAIALDIKSLFGRSLPAGGAVGHVLTKTSAGDWQFGWSAPSGGGGGSGSAPWQTASVDLGLPAPVKSVFVPVPGMTAAQVVEVQRSTTPADGKGSDEHLAEPAVLAGFAETDGFNLQIMAQRCTLGGPMNINYRVS
jgi:hypothetical protein